MNIYEELKKDHAEVQTLLNGLMSAETSDLRHELITEIRDALIPHSRAEEAVFYNVLKDMNEGGDKIGHSYHEHVVAETLLRGLQVAEAVDLNWKSGVAKLKEALSAHIKNEEDEVFALAKGVFTEPEAKILGEAFVEVKSQLGSGLLTSQFELLANLMPERFRISFVNFMKRTENREAV